MHFELEVISVAPRAFIIENFLNDFEVEAILKSAKDKLAMSSVGDVDTGAFASDTRTSLNAWLGRDVSAGEEPLQSCRSICSNCAAQSMRRLVDLLR